MTSFTGLKDNDKVVDKTDGMVMEYRIAEDGTEYLTHGTLAWELWQFSAEDFEKAEA